MSRKSKRFLQEALASRSWAIGTESDRNYWDRKYIDAISFMEKRSVIPAVLIEVAAQHPLKDGRYPNEEFRKRLLIAVKLYKQEIEIGNKVEIYVPGSIHMFEGKVDEISLSKAGGEFLIQQGIPSELILGDELNTKYKGESGVYSSADECFVAASYFKENEFGSLYSVVSPVQVFRKTLHYLELGVLPMSFSVPSSAMFHNYISEIFEAVPYVLFVDHSLQGDNSIRANELRKLRKPSIT